jgi:type II secretory pathway component HofQ
MSGVSSNTHTQEQLDHYSDQNNPNNEQYQADLDNHANQLNPNNDEYWNSRGEEKPGK